MLMLVELILHVENVLSDALYKHINAHVQTKKHSNETSNYFFKLCMHSNYIANTISSLPLLVRWGIFFFLRALKNAGFNNNNNN